VVNRESVRTTCGARLRSFAHATLLSNLARDVHLRALRVGGRLRSRVADRARTPADVSRLRVLAVTYIHLPDERGGAQVTLHSVLRRLARRGHEIRVLVAEGPTRSFTLDGIRVETSPGDVAARDVYRWADVVFGTHLGRGRVLHAAARAGRPVVYYMQLGQIPRHMLWGTPELTVFNSRFLEREYGWIRGGLVLHPPIDETDYLTTRGDAITLVNPIDQKGGQLVLALATRMPKRRFLSVRNWGAVALPERLPPNLTVLDTQADMRAVYSSTRILLVPSAYESYGRVALEAAVSGIPTIARDLGALRESLAEAAIWIDPGADADEWGALINELDDPATYAEWSQRARRRFEELDPEADIDRLERALVRLATSGRRSSDSAHLAGGGVDRSSRN
jgi:hypothetical protein